MPYCKVDTDKVRYSPENLGEILRGDRIVNTPYKASIPHMINCIHEATGPHTYIEHVARYSKVLKII